MNKILAFLSGSGGMNAASLNIRDGLTPVIDGGIAKPSSNLSLSSNYKPDLQVTPDGERVVISSGSNIGFINDINDLESLVYPPVSPSIGYLCGCATSNEYAAIGGNSGSKLMVYSWSDMGIETVLTTGLGDIYGISFNHSGTKLAVVHSSSPYLRVYDTSDWSYTDVSGNVGNGKYRVCFSSDDSIIFCAGYNIPYIAAVDAETVTTLNTYTNSYSHRTYYVYGGIIPNPFKDKSVIRWYGYYASSSYKHITEIDYGAGTETDIWPYPEGGGQTREVLSCAFDIEGRKLIAICKTSYGEPAYHAFDVDTWSEYQAKASHFDFMSLGAGTIAVAQKNIGRVTGTVRDINNNPAARTIRAFDRETGELVAQTKSDAATGNYSITLPSNDVHDFQFMAEDGEQLNDLFFARAIPENIV